MKIILLILNVFLGAAPLWAVDMLECRLGSALSDRILGHYLSLEITPCSAGFCAKVTPCKNLYGAQRSCLQKIGFNIQTEGGKIGADRVDLKNIFLQNKVNLHSGKSLDLGENQVELAMELKLETLWQEDQDEDSTFTGQTLVKMTQVANGLLLSKHLPTTCSLYKTNKVNRPGMMDNQLLSQE